MRANQTRRFFLNLQQQSGQQLVIEQGVHISLKHTTLSAAVANHAQSSLGTRASDGDTAVSSTTLSTAISAPDRPLELVCTRTIPYLA